ncbi:hypothetical protein [Rhizobium mayense]|uniref:DUF4376 domain-containing protein n=1 Tax=Rhizobium mayense TaxID=1312184 RepID=A0ABT7JY19_9HYPH|nr:hypothetical protein [Rhizobium mayense]MDL2401241.1 hypothetical protein [Rhizobium mayense]
MRYGRVPENVVVEIVDLPADITPSDAFHEDIAKTFEPISDDVQEGWVRNGAAFKAPPLPVIALDDIKAGRIAALTAACAAAIIGGYKSSALGSEHTYPSGITDQINMMGSVTASLLPDLAAGWSTPFWCEDEAGEWAFRPHDASQIQQAGSDGKAWIVACQNKLASLSAQVMASISTEDVSKIAW